MARMFKMEAIGYREVQGRFAKRTTELAQTRREVIREEGRALVAALKTYAPKKTGLFAEGIAYRTDERGESTTLTIYVRGEHAFLLPILTGGSRPHEIPRGGSAAQLAKGYPLCFFWQHGPQGPGIYYYWSVQHPGTEPSDFAAKAYESREPQIEANVLRKVRQVVHKS
jgi:hypothetical protein